MHNYCNICFKVDNVLISFNVVDSTSINILTKFQICMPNIDDWNSEFWICSNCCMLLQNSYKFHQFCMDSYRIRRNMRNELTGKNGYRQLDVCTGCGIVFMQIQMDKHINCYNTAARKYKCKFCNEEFLLPHLLETHERSHKSTSISIADGIFEIEDHPNLTHRSSLNDTDTMTQNQIKENVERQNQIEGLVEDQMCHRCFQSFISELELSKHIQVEHPENLELNDINEVVKDEVAESLLQNDMEVNELTEICNICGACFLQIDLLKKHISDSHPIEGVIKTEIEIEETKLQPEKFSCYHCNRRYMKKIELIEHIRLEHYAKIEMEFSETVVGDKKQNVNKVVDDVIEICSLCGVYFVDADLYKQHIRDSHPVKDKVNPEIGIEEPTTPDLSKTHKFQCTLCLQRFRLYDDLYCHLENHQRTRQCTLCNSAFPSQYQLNAHLNRHFEDQILKCHLCNEYYKFQEALDRHITESHPNGTIVQTKSNKVCLKI